jgi:glycosyltransferase involved in cell wall biosynthesis
MKQRCVALLGRRDEPTDAVEEYCQYLGSALKAHGVSLELERFPWCELGWRKALAKMQPQAGHWKDGCVLIQYTALAWSRRGFPIRILRLVRFFRKHGARCGVVFHDAQPYEGGRLVDRTRRQLQIYTMRELVKLVDLAVLTVPVEKARWLPPNPQNVVFIPVGANLPSPETAWMKESGQERPPTVAVFSLSPGPVGAEEVKTIVEALCYVAKRIGSVRLLVFGRNAESAEKLLRDSLHGMDVELSVRGILGAEEAVRVLGNTDVLLFARGPISTRRGSAIAGIACGLPVVAAKGLETTAPITEAGLVLVEPGEQFGPALMHVLGDPDYRASLSERSRRAQQHYFSWQAIAQQYVSALSGTNQQDIGAGLGREFLQ